MPNDPLPLDYYLWAYMPYPAWPAVVDPGYGHGSPTPQDPTFPDELLDATRQHFGRVLFPIGFDVAPPENCERGETLAVPFVRDDLVVMVVVPDSGSLAVLVTGPVDGVITPRRVVQGLVGAGEQASFAAFGSFPLLASGGQALHGQLGRHASAFMDAVGDLLQRSPVDIQAVASAADAAVRATSRSLHASHYRARAAAAWEEGRVAAVVDGYERLAQLDLLDEDERRRLHEAKERVSTLPPALQRADESEHEWIARRAEHLREKGHRLDETIEARDRVGGQAAWEDAAREFREAVDIMYPQEFWAVVQRLREGDPHAVDPMLAFLEVDPWCFRSGYAKETILHLLRRHELAPLQRGRLEAVLLRSVDVGDRREFRSSCRVARRFATQPLRAALRERLHGEDPDVARRALWMLVGLRRPRLDDADVDRARELILRSASGPDRDEWMVPAWVAGLAWRLWSDDWEAELVGLALEGGPGSEAAYRLLSDVPGVQLDPAVRPRLAERLLDVVRRGEDETWFEGLAPALDSPGLRDALVGFLDDPDGDVRRRAHWALNAIRRAQERDERRAGALTSRLRGAVAGPVAASKF